MIAWRSDVGHNDVNISSDGVYIVAIDPHGGRDETSPSDVLAHRIDVLESQLAAIVDAQPIVVPLTSLAPEPFEVLKPLPVLIRGSDDNYVATFFDANISASGDTQEEAFANLKCTLTAKLRIFEAHKDHLGPEPKRQLAVLGEFIRRAR